MSWGATNNIYAGIDGVVIGGIDVSPRTINFREGVSLHILTLIYALSKNLLQDTPLLLFGQFQMDIIEER